MRLNDLLSSVAVTLQNEGVVQSEIDRGAGKQHCFGSYCKHLSAVANSRNMLDVMPAPDERKSGVRVERAFASEDQFKYWLNNH